MPRTRYCSPGNARAARTQLFIGIALLAVGAVITIATYSAASSSPTGGSYFVMWGPMIFGFIRIVTALPVLIKARRAARAGAGPAGTQPVGQWSFSPQAPVPAWTPQQPAGGWAPQAAGGPGPQAARASASGPVAGWYADPGGSNLSRWWDGSAWTEHAR